MCNMINIWGEVLNIKEDFIKNLTQITDNEKDKI